MSIDSMFVHKMWDDDELSKMVKGGIPFPMLSDAEGRLGRNWLKGRLGDRIKAVLCGAGQNIRIILRKLREGLLFFVLHFLFGRLWQDRSRWSHWHEVTY